MTVSDLVATELLERMCKRMAVVQHMPNSRIIFIFFDIVGFNCNTVVNYLLYVEVPRLKFLEQIITSRDTGSFDNFCVTILQDVVIFGSE